MAFGRPYNTVTEMLVARADGTERVAAGHQPKCGGEDQVVLRVTGLWFR